MHRPLVALALLAAPAAAAEPAAKPAAVAPAAKVRLEPDVVYATVGGEKLRLDLALPPGPGPHPLVVCFHGGAWKYGTRKDLSTTRSTFNQDYGTGGKSFTEWLAGNGFAAASVGYRLAPKSRFPAQVEDAKTAVRFLRANAKLFGLDPDRVAAMGFSAGGHLAALLGTTGPDAGFDGPLYPDQPSGVTCVVDFFGPADLSLYAETAGIEGAYMVPLLGSRYAAKPEVYRKASPVAHASKGDAPTLIVHGTADLIVPVIHSERLFRRLTDAGVTAELVTVSGKGHGWAGPAAADTTRAALRFLDRHLKGKR